MKRITSDIDTKNERVISDYIFKTLIKVEKIKKIELKPSFKKGWHLIVWTTHPYNLKQVFFLREFLGDDKTRLRLDKKRHFGRDTLFYKKEPMKGGITNFNGKYRTNRNKNIKIWIRKFK